MSAEQKRNHNTESNAISNRGFSLIELLVVVAVILIIAAIAIPNFIRAKIAANESSAVQNCHIIATANVVYFTTYSMGFAASLPNLGGNPSTPSSTAAGLVDQVLSNGIKSGYVFTYTVLTTDPIGQVTSYSVNADPQSATTGTRHFYTDQTAVIRANESVAAGPTDPALQ